MTTDDLCDCVRRASFHAWRKRDNLVAERAILAALDLVEAVRESQQREDLLASIKISLDRFDAALSDGGTSK